MAKSRTVMLAGSPIEVPMLPIRLNKIAYPLCRKLHNEKLLDRIIEGKGHVNCSAEEMDDLIEIAFVAACASNPRISREEFDNWPITPPELVDAFFHVRFLTGGWVDNVTEPAGGEENELGEAPGAETLPT